MTGENVLLLRSQDSKVVDVVPTKDFSNFKVDASLSFDARKTSQQNDVPKTEEEDNVIDVDVGVTKPSSVTKDDTDEMCRSLNVPCFAIPAHPCCDKSEIVVGSKKIEKLVDLSKINIETSSSPGDGFQPQSEGSAEETFDVCATVSCRTQPRHPCCKKPTQSLFPASFSTTARSPVTAPPTRRVFHPKPEMKLDQDVPSFEVEIKNIEGVSLQIPESDYEEESTQDSTESFEDFVDVTNGSNVGHGGDEEDDHDVEMCMTLNVPCKVIPKHPCCKHAEKNFKPEASNRINFPFKLSTPSPTPVETTTVARQLTTTAARMQLSTVVRQLTSTAAAKDEISISKHQIRELCRALTISCKRQREHICCKDSIQDEPLDADAGPQGRDPSTQLDEASQTSQDNDQTSSQDDFAFSRIANTLRTPKPAPDTSRPHLSRTAANLMIKPQQNDMKSSDNIFNPNEDLDDSAEHSEDPSSIENVADQQFDFSRTAQRTTASYTPASIIFTAFDQN